METDKNQSQISAKQINKGAKKDKYISLESTKSCTRYSDEDLKEFKELISVKLHKSKIDYELLKEALTLKGDNGTKDTSPSFKFEEDAADLFAREEISNLAIRQRKYIEHLENALIRIENKTYGICTATGKLISKERLRSVPHSTMSIDAKRDGLNV
ncbi:MAG TPA: TraR/DksA family transcriptional regulator [Bacteroidia bacterium]|jgi:DnaK suppressor protein|nr:TraR/DksA family transcriptional regulator [Bacteroidia bacterium]